MLGRTPLVAFASLLVGLFSLASLSIAKESKTIDFANVIQPILETNCLSCHDESEAEGGLRLDTRAAAMTGGDRGPSIVPGKPDESPLFELIALDADDGELMPPTDSGGPLTKQSIESIRNWIATGAEWPADLRLQKKAKPSQPGSKSTPDNATLIQRIHDKITSPRANAHRRKVGAMVDYRQEIPATKVPFEMIAIKGGEFAMGSPEGEAHRDVNEGPQTKIRVASFWMGKCEVSWDEYEPYMATQVDRHKNGSRIDFDETKHTMVDAVSQPTPPYMEMSFGMGQKGYPAISMTHHAANKYCQWLSAQTGKFYRLPTEAEWEFACRAGTTTAYSFGDDTAKIGDYAWYYENSNEKYQKVGTKKPNPWGLHDMHGNVMEWTADAFAPNYFETLGSNTTDPFLKPDRLYPRSVRGGSWDDDPEQLRSAARRGSDEVWKMQDPQLPKSIWYHTDAQWLGFRIVRPLKTPSVQEMDFYWNSARGKIR